MSHSITKATGRRSFHLLRALGLASILAAVACGSAEPSNPATGSEGGSGGSGGSSSVATSGTSSSTSGNTASSTTSATSSSSGSGMGGSGGMLGCTLEQVAPKKVYHIGHSLTDRTDRTFNNLVEKHTGQSIQYFSTSIPGSPLKWHWDSPEDGAKGNMNSNLSPLDLLKTGQFDVLSMTDSIPPTTYSHNAAIEWVKAFVDNATTPNPEVFIYSIWARRKTGAADDAQSIQKWMQETTSFQAKWEELAQVVQDAYPTLNVRIIPVGLVLQELQQRVTNGTLVLPGGLTFRQTFFQQNRPGSQYGGCETPDHIHLSKTGIYTSAVAHYTAIFGSRPVGLPMQIPYSSYNDGCVTANDVNVDPALAAVIQEVAWDVLNDYAWSGVCSP